MTYYEEHKQERIQYAKNHNSLPEIKEKVRLRNKLYLKIIKFKVIFHYSNGTLKCNCCGEDTYEFLTIDHINNNGSEHRRKENIKMIYNWLIKRNYPKGFQILCYNCNCCKGFLGYCPHNT